MPALYVENVPESLYEALRERAKRNGNSIAAEVLALLTENIPDDAELQRRRELFLRTLALRAAPPASPGPFPTTEEMQRVERER